MFGKIYLLLHIFDKMYEKHNLRYLYMSEDYEFAKVQNLFTDCQVYDDGVLRFLLIKLKNLLSPQLRKENQNEECKDKDLSVKGG